MSTTAEVPLWREPTRGQWMSFLAAWFGWVLDAFDFTIFLMVMPRIAKDFNVTITRAFMGRRLPVGQAAFEVGAMVISA